ncbi:uroporphyrinogen-III synthase [Salipaludibacillus keqinensis]|uniref:uroporphyrinogen-III synthase n=1 Tax=Salipaludibacillus keqinensis TaxID=2045207 RepID=UPI0038CD72F4
MNVSLLNKTVVLAASRKTNEMSKIIEKQQGTPLVRSLQGTVFLNDQEVRKDLERDVEENYDWMIFTTGIGVNALLDMAKDMNIKDQYLKSINEATIAARGYKTFAALKKIGVTPTAKDDDGTIKGLIASLQPYDFNGKRVMVQLHGENAPSLLEYLIEEGAIVFPILPYKHVDPKPETVERFCQEVLAGEIDAVCFTAAIQVRSLFKYAKEKRYSRSIVDAFMTHTMAVAVGKVTAEALHEEGIDRIVKPDLERMGAMIVELSNYYEEIEKY